MIFWAVPAVLVACILLLWFVFAATARFHKNYLNSAKNSFWQKAGSVQATYAPLWRARLEMACSWLYRGAMTLWTFARIMCSMMHHLMGLFRMLYQASEIAALVPWSLLLVIAGLIWGVLVVPCILVWATIVLVLYTLGIICGIGHAVSDAWTHVRVFFMNKKVDLVTPSHRLGRN